MAEAVSVGDTRQVSHGTWHMKCGVNVEGRGGGGGGSAILKRQHNIHCQHLLNPPSPLRVTCDT